MRILRRFGEYVFFSAFLCARGEIALHRSRVCATTCCRRIVPLHILPCFRDRFRGVAGKTRIVFRTNNNMYPVIIN